MLGEDGGQVGAADQRFLKDRAKRGVDCGRAADADQHRAFLDRFANRGDARGVVGTAKRHGEVVVGAIDAAAGEDDRAPRKGHSGGALDNQDVGRADFGGTHHDQGRGGNCGFERHRPLLRWIGQRKRAGIPSGIPALLDPGAVRRRAVLTSR